MAAIISLRSDSQAPRRGTPLSARGATVRPMEKQCSSCGAMTDVGVVVETFPADSWIREAWLLCPPCLEEQK